LAEHELNRSLFDSIKLARRGEKLATLALLCLLLTAAAASVTSVLSGPDWGSLWTSLLLGLLIGWALAVFRQPAWRSAWIVMTAGLIYSVLYTGGLGGQAAAVLTAYMRLAVNNVATHQLILSDWIHLARVLGSFFASIGVISDRVQDWVVALATGQSFFDPVAAALVWGFLIWIVAAWAGWVVEARQNALVAISPAVLLSAGTLSYGRRDSLAVYLMLGMVLILLATVQHDRRELGWEKAGIAYPAKKGRQIGSAAVLSAVVLVLFSAFVSWISLQRIVDWLSLQRNLSPLEQSGLAKSLGMIPAVTASPDTFQAVRSPGLPRELLIGSGPELSKRLVMTVALSNPASFPEGGQPLPIYWRSFTYDIYTGHGWRTSQTQTSVYQASRPLQADHAADHILVYQEVNPVETASGTIYADGELVSVNLQAEAAWRSSDDLFGIQSDGGGSYEARSLVPLIDAPALRSAGQKYPAWVMQRYLALPPEVPARVKDLAIRLTASEPTPYDRAKAIERYLRTYPYTLDVPRPPSDQDLVDYFLFGLGKGYCDYYASAMVVLSRAAGIPARLAIGYASGTYNLNSKRFVVSEADAHSWVEVYFPGIGWMPFEPTASRPALEASQQSIPATPVVTASAPKSPAVTSGQSTSWGWLLLLVALALSGVLFTAWTFFDYSRLSRLSELVVAVEIYRRMRRSGARFSVTLEPGDTPYEFATRLIARLQELAHQGVTSAIELRVIQEVEAITDRIVLASYRPSLSQTASGRPLSREWQTLKWQLNWIWFLEKWKYLGKRLVTRFTGFDEQSSAG
jgi:transglutaminase-like putative cysteine protease